MLSRKKHSLHVMIDADMYQKLRHVCFYDHVTLAEVIRRLLTDFLAERATADPEISVPRRL